MARDEQWQAAFKAIECEYSRRQEIVTRFREQLKFAAQLAEHVPARQEAWEALILRAIETWQVAAGKGGTAEEALAEAEAVMAPIGREAKTYTIHCVGHAHIDMNWQWSWAETVAVVNDTFSTMDRLMDEFPDFLFSQSQASVYAIMKDYLPELYETVKQRVREGRWEISASQWVEGDKNMASGESLSRHLLYSRRFFKQEFGLPYDAITIDWEPDTFGHAWTVPTILSQGGVRWYFMHRGGRVPKLFWWQGRDGARILALDNNYRGYNGAIHPGMHHGMLAFEHATGLKDFLFVYGVGDHGGGPTRQYLRSIRQMDAWPVFPRIIFSTLNRFFTIAESRARNLPVIDGELNCVFEGCYSSQSRTKYANRRSENMLGEAEVAALLGRSLVGMPYPAEGLEGAWRKTLFNQFHDILPGSGVKATCDYTLGLFQEIAACASMITTRALRKIVERIDVAAIKVPGVGSTAPGEDPVTSAMDAGHGSVAVAGAVSQRGPVAGSDLACVVFNPNPWPRSETAALRIWDRPESEQAYRVYDDLGRMAPAQIAGRGAFWAHRFVNILFPAAHLPALGYRTFRIVPALEPQPATGGCAGDGKGRIENDYFMVDVEQASGAIVHLVDKASGMDLVPPGGRLGFLEYILEAPHGMTSWIIGQPLKTIPLVEGGSLECPLNGPHRASVCTGHTLNDSALKLTISLSAGVPRVDFELEVNWLERGSATNGVPALKVAFPLALADGIARYEVPFGHVPRSTRKADIVSLTSEWINCYSSTRQGIDMNPAEVPAQQWADLTGRAPDGATLGATLLNDSKYGHSIVDNVIRLTLLRSSYDPDPLPELGQHTFRFSLRPHMGEWTVSEATRAGQEFNRPLSVVAATAHTGPFPSCDRFVEVLTPEVMLGGMKKAEDSEALIMRLYDMEGQATVARVWISDCLARADAPAVVTDIMEQPLASNTARMENNVLSVDIPAFGLVTVKVG